jgi:hypothetical protein
MFLRVALFVIIIAMTFITVFSAALDQPLSENSYSTLKIWIICGSTLTTSLAANFCPPVLETALQVTVASITAHTPVTAGPSGSTSARTPSTPTAPATCPHTPRSTPRAGP